MALAPVLVLVLVLVLVALALCVLGVSVGGVYHHKTIGGYHLLVGLIEKLQQQIAERESPKEIELAPLYHVWSVILLCVSRCSEAVCLVRLAALSTCNTIHLFGKNQHAR